MAERSLIFPQEEYRQRVATLQDAMARSDMDVVLFTSPADIYYVTGFLTRFWESPARPWFILLPASGVPVAVIPSIGAELMGKTWIGEVRTWDAPNPQDDGVSLLVETLCDMTPPTARIGVPMGLETSLRMPLSDYQTVTSQIASRSVVDATEAVQRTREIKSEAEIAKIRSICKIADAAFARVPQLVENGTTLDQVFRQFQIALLDEGADWVSYVAGGAGQGGYGDVISPAENVALRSGDILMLDTGAVRDGYFCDFDRNFAIGKADDAAARAYSALFEATEVALATMRPGMSAADVHRILADELRAQGTTPCGGRLGHGLGLTLTEWPSFTPLDKCELRAGMVLTLEPSVEIAPGRIMVHEENIVLRDSGPDLLSRRAPSELPVIAL